MLLICLTNSLHLINEPLIIPTTYFIYLCGIKHFLIWKGVVGDGRTLLGCCFFLHFVLFLAKKYFNTSLPPFPHPFSLYHFQNFENKSTTKKLCHPSDKKMVVELGPYTTCLYKLLWNVDSLFLRTLLLLSSLLNFGL